MIKDNIIFKISLFFSLIIFFTYVYYTLGEGELTLDDALYIAVSYQTFTSSCLTDKSFKLQYVAILQMISSYVLVLYSVLD